MVSVGAHYLGIKRRTETPDGSVQMTPTASTESMSQERERICSIDVVLDNEEVAALAVNPDDLIKVCSI